MADLTLGNESSTQSGNSRMIYLSTQSMVMNFLEGITQLVLQKTGTNCSVTEEGIELKRMNGFYSVVGNDFAYREPWLATSTMVNNAKKKLYCQC